MGLGSFFLFLFLVKGGEGVWVVRVGDEVGRMVDGGGDGDGRVGEGGRGEEKVYRG